MNSRSFHLLLCTLIIAIAILLGAGCDHLRFAPNEIQKQHAWLHQKTTQATAIQAQTEDASPVLQSLASRAAFGPRPHPARSSAPVSILTAIRTAPALRTASLIALISFYLSVLP